MNDSIYLDWASHTPADSRVLESFLNSERIGNPTSKHYAGYEAKKIIDEATIKTAQFLDVKPSEIIYTSGASEANNTAIKGFAKAQRHKGKHIITTTLEHPSVSGTLTALKEQGYEIDIVNIKLNGKVDCEHLRELLREDTILVTICVVDSEIGSVQPILEIVDILKSYPECRFHVDAAQAIGKIPFSFDGIDSASISPHKFFGICGCGILWKRDGIILEPLIHGGSSTTIYRSGTPAVSLAVSISKAISLAYHELDNQLNIVAELNKKLRKKLLSYPLVRINSPNDAVPHILNISVKGVKGAVFQEKLDEYGVYVSVKSACSTPNTPSRSVFAISKDRQNALSSWRISLSRKTTETDIEKFFTRFDIIYKEITK